MDDITLATPAIICEHCGLDITATHAYRLLATERARARFVELHIGTHARAAGPIEVPVDPMDALQCEACQ